jgi:hypothetical protein
MWPKHMLPNKLTKWFISRFKYVIHNNFDKFAFMNEIDQGMEINKHMSDSPWKKRWMSQHLICSSLSQILIIE